MTVDVKITIIIPETEVEPTQTQIQEWLRYSFGYTASCSGSNPLVNEEPEIDYMSVGRLVKD